MIGTVFWRTHNRYTLGQHDLISYARVKIARGHEARLCRVSMDPATNHELLTVDVVEQLSIAGISGIACVARGDLVRNDEMGDEEGVRNKGSAENPARLEVEQGVGCGEGEEARS